MALTFSDLRKPTNSQVIDPSTGRMREEWILYFDSLTKRLNGAVGELSGTIGDVTGPASSTDGNLASFDGTDGKTIQDSGIAAADVLVDGDIGSDVQAHSANLDGWAAEDPGDYSTTAEANALYQPVDADLTAVAALASTGLVARTGAATYAERTIAGAAAGVSVSNGDGVAGNPTLVLANDLEALEALASTGLAARTGSDTWAQRTITAGTGISISNGDGVSGNPTISASFVHVLFDGTTDDNVTGTYSRSGTTVTVSVTAHGHVVGHRVYLDFTTGTAADGIFTITSVADPDTFTVTHGTSGTTSGNVTLLRRAITASSGVSNVIYHNSIGTYTINFSAAFANANYHVWGSAGTTDSDSVMSPDTSNITDLHCEIFTWDNSAAAAENSPRISVVFMPT